MLRTGRRFILSKYPTTDGYIAKYPPRMNDPSTSPIGLYYRSFRDINSVKRNASFLLRQDGNAIVVTIENLYKYAYLYAFRELFEPPDAWLFGNLSPLVNVKALERNKKLYVHYALSTSRALRGIEQTVSKSIQSYYGIETGDGLGAKGVEAIRRELNELARERD